MFDFINPKDYYSFYIYFSLILILFTIIHSYVLTMEEGKNVSFINVVGYILLFLISFFAIS